MKVPEQQGEERGSERKRLGRRRLGLVIAAGVVALAAMLALASAVVDDARDARAGSREAARAAAEESLREQATAAGSAGPAASPAAPVEPPLAAVARPGAPAPGTRVAGAPRSRPAAPVLAGVEAAAAPAGAAATAEAAAPAATPSAAEPRRPAGRSRKLKASKSKATTLAAASAPSAAHEAARAPEHAVVVAAAGAAAPHPGPDAAPRPPGRAVAVAELARRPIDAENPGAPDQEGELVRVEHFAKGGASLAGRVLDAETGRALGGVVVEARLAGRYVGVSTDSSGAFRMPGMLPGTRVVVWIGGARDPFVAERVEVSIPAAGQVADTGVVRLLRGDELAARLDGWVGLFVGRRAGHVTVSALSPWLPAERAGVEVGDVLVSVDGRDIAGLGPRAVTFLLRGPTGTAAAVVAEDHTGARRKLDLQRVMR